MQLSKQTDEEKENQFYRLVLKNHQIFTQRDIVSGSPEEITLSKQSTLLQFLQMDKTIFPNYQCVSYKLDKRFPKDNAANLNGNAFYFNGGSLFNIEKGSENEQRSGNTIKVKKIDVSLIFKGYPITFAQRALNPLLPVNWTDQIRIMMVLDKNPNGKNADEQTSLSVICGSQYRFNQVLNTSFAGPSSIFDAQEMFHSNNQYEIMYDKRIVYNNKSSSFTLLGEAAYSVPNPYVIMHNFSVHTDLLVEYNKKVLYGNFNPIIKNNCFMIISSTNELYTGIQLYSYTNVIFNANVVFDESI